MAKNASHEPTLMVRRIDDDFVFPSQKAVVAFYRETHGIRQVAVLRALQQSGGEIFFSEQDIFANHQAILRRIHATPSNAIQIKYKKTGQVFRSVAEAARMLGFKSQYQMFKELGEENFEKVS